MAEQALDPPALVYGCDIGAQRAPEFAYPLLNLYRREIRVIEVLPLDSDALIRCRIKVVDLEDKHVASSYVWGVDKPSHEIDIDGRKSHVRKNLAAFLRHASLHMSNQIIWIDAICINQEDISERNHQVRQMIDIYKSARLVLIWLGQSLDKISPLCSMINLVSDCGLANEDRFQPPDSRPYINLANEVHDKHHEAMFALCEAEYWSRLWVVPEVLSAQTLSLACCDGCLIPWDRLSRFLRALSYGQFLGFKPTRFSFDYRKLLEFSSMKQNKRIDYSFFRLIQTYGANHCSEPRDKVFALSGLSSDAANLHIDYNMSTADIYVQAISFSRVRGPTFVEMSLRLFEILEIELGIDELWLLISQLARSLPAELVLNGFEPFTQLIRCLKHRLVKTAKLRRRRIYSETCWQSFVDVADIKSTQSAIELFKTIGFDVEALWLRFSEFPSFAIAEMYRIFDESTKLPLQQQVTHVHTGSERLGFTALQLHKLRHQPINQLDHPLKLDFNEYSESRSQRVILEESTMISWEMLLSVWREQVGHSTFSERWCKPDVEITNDSKAISGRTGQVQAEHQVCTKRQNGYAAASSVIKFQEPDWEDIAVFEKREIQPSLGRGGPTTHSIRAAIITAKHKPASHNTSDGTRYLILGLLRDSRAVRRPAYSQRYGSFEPVVGFCELLETQQERQWFVRGNLTGTISFFKTMHKAFIESDHRPGYWQQEKNDRPKLKRFDTPYPNSRTKSTLRPPSSSLKTTIHRD